MPAQTTNYQCPACTGPLHFSSNSGKLQCEFCDSIYEVAEIEALLAQKQEKAAQAFTKQEQSRAQDAHQNNNGSVPAPGFQSRQNNNEENLWTTEKLNTDWGQEAAHMRAYNCESCGAQIICDDTTAATSCHYCGNPTVVPGQFAGSLKPDYIIPFKYDKAMAKKALLDFCKGKFLLPKFFSKDAHIEEIKGVYVPFWIFDGSVDADINYKASNSTSRRSGDYRITTTHHYQVQRAGNVAFRDIPVDACSKMPDIYMESIEPFDYGDIKPFSTAYMPGYFADKYDVDINNCSPRADERAVNTAVELMRKSVNSYSRCTEVSRRINLYRGDVHYLLAPVWMLSTKYLGKNYIFAMNGQTGKFVGKLPCDYLKLYGFIAALTAGITALSYFIVPFFI